MPNNDRDDTDHDRLVRLEERGAQWIQHVRAEIESVRRQLSDHRQILLWLVGLLGTAAVGLVVTLLTRAG